jgi:hypothetical protein
MKPIRSLLSFLVVAVICLTSTLPALAEIPTVELLPGGEGEGEAEAGNLLGSLRYLEPIQHVLSGSVGLVAQGIDNRMFMQGESFRTPDGANFSPLQSVLNIAPNAPSLQAGGTGLLVPYRDPAPAFSRNLLVTRDFSARTLQTEPHIVVNPQDPDHLVLGTIDYNFPSNSVYVSIDGGESWEGPKQTKYLRDDLGSGGDPVLAFDNNNNVYLASISIGVDEFKVGPIADEALVSSIAVASSNDGGFTWNDPVSSARATVESQIELDPSGRVRGNISFGFLDKPWLTVGPHPTIEDQNMIYVTYTEFVTRFDILYIGELPVLSVPETLTTPKLVSSADGGVTWTEPVAVGPTVRSTLGEGESEGEEGGEAEAVESAEPIDQPSLPDEPGVIQQKDENEAEGTKRVIQGPVPVVDSKGILYVSWLDSTDDDSMKGLGELYIARSEDGGVAFDKPVRIASFLEIPFRPRNAFFRYWASAFPKVAVGPADELYVVYTALPPDNNYDEGDIFFIRSTNGGTRWSRPKRLNQDETSSVQFFPAISVAPNGKIHVMWGDMRDDGVGTRYHIYYTSSEDQGETWGFENEELGLQVPDTRVSDFPTNPNRAFPSGVFIGDYFALASTDEEVYMVWPDGRLGEYGAVNQKIGFARQQAVPSPEIFLSPDTGPGGETITVQGHGYQPDLNFYLQVGGATVYAGRTNSDGVITASVFVPISGEGAHPVSLVDESGNVAATSFYMEFGFDNIQTSLQALDKQLDQLSTTVTNTSGLQGATNQLASFQPNELARLTAQVQRLQEEMKGKQAIAASAEETMVASGLWAGNSSLLLGLVGLAGLTLGIVLTQVRMNK